MPPAQPASSKPAAASSSRQEEDKDESQRKPNSELVRLGERLRGNTIRGSRTESL